MKRYSATYKIVTALLTLYYLLSLCGFNVHHDTVCGKSYLTLLYLGTDCSDIHPDSSCCQHSGNCTHSACSQHSEVCTHSNCGKHSGDCGNSKGREIAGAFSGHCNHCFNESGIADDTADLRSGRIRDREPLAALATRLNDNTLRKNPSAFSAEAFKRQDGGRLHAIPLSMLCVSRT